MIKHLKFLLPILVGFGLSSMAFAGPFDPKVVVNNSAISQFELTQREKFLEFIRQRGDLKQLAYDGLIEDRLRMQAAQSAGIRLTPEALEDEISSFAARANMTKEQFERVLKSAGVEKETLAFYVEANVTWREVVRSRFARQGQISDAEVDREIANGANGGGLRVLFSEIVLPGRAQVRGEVARSMRRAERISKIRSASEFSANARKYSFSPSRSKGGRIPWMNLSEVPEGLRGILLGLSPGEVTAPLRVENAILLFQLRDLQETKPAKKQTDVVEYATIDVPENQIQRVQGNVDVCDDLYGVAKRTKNPTLQRTALPIGDVEQSLALQLATLDPNETAILPGAAAGTLRFIVLCGRTFKASDDVSRDVISDRLRQRRLGSLADGYMAELKSRAKIIQK